MQRTFIIADRFIGGSDYKIDPPGMEGGFAHCYRVSDQEQQRVLALKILRPRVRANLDGRFDWVDPDYRYYEAFPREARFLDQLNSERDAVPAGSARFPQLYGQGFIRDLNYKDIGSGDWPTGGTVEEVSIDQFCDEQVWRARWQDGWRPFLMLEYFPLEKNVHLMHLFYELNNQASLDQDGRVRVHLRMPLIYALEFGLQIAKLLKFIHGLRDPIYYPDHKMAHCFWNGRQAALIDWNVAWYESEAGQISHCPSDNSPQKDIRQFAFTAFFGLLTGEHPDNLHRIGPTVSAASEDRVLTYFDNHKDLYPEGIRRLFEEIHQGKVPNAIALEARYERLRNELFGAESGNEADYTRLCRVMANLEEIRQLIEEVEQDVSQLINRRGLPPCPDSIFLGDVIALMLQYQVIPWASEDREGQDY